MSIIQKVNLNSVEFATHHSLFKRRKIIQCSRKSIVYGVLYKHNHSLKTSISPVVLLFKSLNNKLIAFCARTKAERKSKIGVEKGGQEFSSSH